MLHDLLLPKKSDLFHPITRSSRPSNYCCNEYATRGQRKTIFAVKYCLTSRREDVTGESIGVHANIERVHAIGDDARWGTLAQYRRTNSSLSTRSSLTPFEELLFRPDESVISPSSSF